MKLLLCAIALFLTGCASVPAHAPPSLFGGRPPLNASTPLPDIDVQFYTVLGGCQTVLAGFQQQAQVAKDWGAAVQLVGGLLGSVLLPIAVAKSMAHSVLVGLGAGAGFANTATSVIQNEALDAGSVLAT